MLRKLALGALPFAAAVAAVPASAAVPTTCVGYATTVLNNWSACAGFYDKNVFSSSAADVQLQQEAVSFLDGSFDGDFNALFGFGNLSNSQSGARTIDFGKTIYGVNIIGAHFGNLAGPQGNVSAFYKFDFGSQGVTSLTFVDAQGLSSLYVYAVTPPVPEPVTWALLILGFGVVGASLRRRSAVARATKAAITFA